MLFYSATLRPCMPDSSCWVQLVLSACSSLPCVTSTGMLVGHQSCRVAWVAVVHNSVCSVLGGLGKFCYEPRRLVHPHYMACHKGFVSHNSNFLHHCRCLGLAVCAIVYLRGDFVCAVCLLSVSVCCTCTCSQHLCACSQHLLKLCTLHLRSTCRLCLFCNLL